MSSMALWAFVFEIAVIIFLAWGVKNESKLIAFENRIMDALRKAVHK